MIATVVPNWNGEKYLAESLESLLAQSQKTEIIVVDGGSSDGSVELVKSKFPGVALVELPENRGFAGGVNAGLKRAMEMGAEFVALFNNDAVADKDWVKNLLETAKQNPKIGLVTGKFLQYTDRTKIDSTGDFYSIWGLPFPRGRDETDAGQFDAEEEVFGGSGGASLLRAEMLKQIGLFDEDFFAYYEDVDLSFRAQLAGWKVMYQPKALAWHRIGSTSSKIPNFARYHTIKNFIFLYVKNMPGWLFWKYLPRFAAAKILIAGNSLKRGQIMPLFKAWGVALVKLPKMISKRSKIQRTRAVSPGYIDSILYKKLPPTQKTLAAFRARFTRP